MPAKSKSQQRLFGMVHAYQKGELDNPSKEIKDIAKSITKKDAKDFAETKHKGLPNRVKKNKKKTNENCIKLSEDALMNIIKESVEKCLKEDYVTRKARWSDILKNKIYSVMQEIENEMEYYERLDSSDNIDEDDVTIYSALKKAYDALDELLYV